VFFCQGAEIFDQQCTAGGAIGDRLSSLFAETEDAAQEVAHHSGSTAAVEALPQ
jgi:hypothetical protein